jgi:hypothetical protein
MEKSKKTFVLHTDLIEQVQDLENEQAGELFKMILSYVAEGVVNESPDKMVTWAFKGIKKQIDIDCAKYAEKCEETRKKTTLGGIISSLKVGKTHTKDSLQFLSDEGYLNKTYLTNCGIGNEIVQDVLQRANKLKLSAS